MSRVESVANPPGMPFSAGCEVRARHANTASQRLPKCGKILCAAHAGSPDAGGFLAGLRGLPGSNAGLPGIAERAYADRRSGANILAGDHHLGGGRWIEGASLGT